MASSICLSSNLLRYISVVFISWCPNAWEIRAILTPVFFKMLAKECLASWKEISNTSNGNEKKSQRNLLVISYFSIFLHINEKQKSEACRGYSVTKSLAGLLPAGIR